MERNPDAARDRFPVAERRAERPLSCRDDGRLVEVRRRRLQDVDLRDVAVRVDRHGEHHVGVLPLRERGRRIDGIDVRDDHGRRRLRDRGDLGTRGLGESERAEDERDATQARQKARIEGSHFITRSIDRFIM